MLLAAASWTIGNLLGEIAARAAAGRVLRVRYEDLRDHPAEELQRIGTFLGIDVTPVLERLLAEDPLSPHHLIGGNDVRLQPGLRFDPAVERRRPPLPRWLQIATLLLCGPLMVWYGYRLKPRDPSRPDQGGERSPLLTSSSRTVQD
jgi:hypothetical protein